MAASEIPLADLTPGTPARIVRLAEHPATARLLAMGLRPGMEVRLIRTAAFGASLYLQTAFQQFGIRKDEAKCIWVRI